MDLASSLAGLIGLAGLAVQSASTLYSFYRKVPRVAGEVEAIIIEVQRFSQTPESIQHISSDRATQKLSPRTNGIVTKLQDEIAKCTTDLEDWNSSMTALKLSDGRWAGNTLKKLKLAADAGRFSEMRLKIAAHRDQLMLLIELVTVDLEILTSQVVDGLNSEMHDIRAEQTSHQTANISCLENIQAGVQAVTRIQGTTQAETSNISKATQSMRDTLQDIQTSQATSH